jgi:hypothetical protein
VARLHAARARAEALELHREGKSAEARARLEKTAQRILGYAGDDGELKAMEGGPPAGREGEEVRGAACRRAASCVAR